MNIQSAPANSAVGVHDLLGRIDGLRQLRKDHCVFDWSCLQRTNLYLPSVGVLPRYQLAAPIFEFFGRHDLNSSVAANGCYSITSSARPSSVGGTESPSFSAVLRLTTSSYLVGACTGRSAGLSPLRMRSM